MLRESRRIWDLSREPDSDPESELWRVRTNRRLQLVLIVALVGLLIPSAANVVPAWVATFSAATVAVQLLFTVGVVSMLAVFSWRFAREAVRYGNGEAVTLYRLLTPAGGVLVLLILLGAWITLPY
jgi:membrane protein YdbS with pleckstrin-like domain